MKTNKTVATAESVPSFLMLRTEVAEVHDPVSMTQPEQVSPLEVLLTHRDKGMSVPFFNGVFSDQDTPDVSKMDFIELAQLRENTAAGIEAAEEDLHAINKQMEVITLQEKKYLADLEEARKLKKETKQTSGTDASNNTP